MDSRRPSIHGTDVDHQGRCAHYHSDCDVVANRCALCGEWWACYLCHEDVYAQGDVYAHSAREEEKEERREEGEERGGVASHSLAPMSLTVPAALCGACGYAMCYEEYSTLEPVACPSCRHAFNPGCSAHASLYFTVGKEGS